MEALKLEVRTQEDKAKSKGLSLREKIQNTHTSELFIGICSPIGSSKEIVISELKENLESKYKYKVVVIKISEFIDRYQTSNVSEITGKTNAYSNLMHKINQGDELRKKYSNNSILVELAIKKIFNERTAEIPSVLDKLPHPEDYNSRRVCYIIDSIKNMEEALLLRSIYEELFYLISVFSPYNERENNLRLKNLAQNEIEEIISTDEYENNSFGQNVRNTFAEGDFFIRVSNENKDKVNLKIERLLHLIFESDIITPTPDENAMYVAKSAAGNSACLSRQVGASITDNIGNVVSKGWNDVPKYGGNLYQEGNIQDDRCKFRGYCSNDKQKINIVESIVDSIVRDNELNIAFKNEDNSINMVMLKRFSDKLRSSKIKDLIEFSRSVHAEMHAIISGSQLSGSKMVGGKLFCTTYPCHNCARHIIVAGINEIYYIEPYIKSLCIELHNDAITEDENEDGKVKILMYDGVAPRKYLTFFSKRGERKDKNGKFVPREYDKVIPKMSKTLQALSTLEQQAIHSLTECGFQEN